MDDEDLDTHICLKCQKTIVGLENYVTHRRMECPSLLNRPGTSPSKDKPIPCDSLTDFVTPCTQTAELLPTSEPSQLRSDDFFLSLELKSSKAVEQKTSDDIKDVASANLPVEESDSGVNEPDKNKVEEEAGKNSRSDFVFMVDDSEEVELDEDDEDYDQFDDYPPRGHTGGKWKPGMRPGNSNTWLSGTYQQSPKTKQHSSARSNDAPKSGSARRQGRKITLKCEPCDLAFANERGLVSHLASSEHWLSSKSHPLHETLILKYAAALAPLAPFKCSICSFYFNDMEELCKHCDTDEAVHKEKVGPNRQLVCTFCKFRCWTNAKMLNHLKDDLLHAEGVSVWNPIVVSATSEFCCSKCNWTCGRQQALFSHMRWKHSKNIHCPTCRISFPNEEALALHNALNEHVIEGYDCPFCPFVGTTKASVAAHTKQEHPNVQKSVELSISEDGMYKMTKLTGAKLGKNVDRDQQPKKFSSPKPKSKKTPPRRSSDSISSGIAMKEDGDVEETVENIVAALHLSSPPSSCVVDKDHSYYDGGVSSASSDTAKDDDCNYEGDGGRAKPARGPNASKRCIHCEQKFANQDDLKTHVVERHPDKLLHCEPCCATFVSNSDLELHKKTRIHLCNTKDIRDIEKGLLIPTEEFLCEHCTFRSASKSAIIFHAMMHAQLNPQSSVGSAIDENIDVMEIVLSMESGISLEKEKEGENSVEEETADEDQQKQSGEKKLGALYKCPICERAYSLTLLRDHINIHTGETPFVCVICNASFALRGTLASHRRSKHVEKKHACPHCSYRSNRRAKLNEHMETHNERVRQYTCDTCGAGFYKGSALTLHMKLHLENKGKRILCTFEGCNKAFRTPSELTYHNRVHNGDRPYLCETCGYSTKSRHQLTKHERGHSGVRPFKCDYCSYASSRSAQLRRHMRVHSRVKPYSCPYCTYTCNTQENLRKHVLKSKKHHGLSVYPCQHCQFGCNAANDMREHTILEHPSIAKLYEEDSPAFAGLVTGIYNQKADIRAPNEAPAPYVPLTEKRDMYKMLHSKLRENPAALKSGDGNENRKDNGENEDRSDDENRVSFARKQAEQSEARAAIKNLMKSTKRKGEVKNAPEKRAKEHYANNSVDSPSKNEDSQLFQLFQDNPVIFKREEEEQAEVVEQEQIAIYAIEYPGDQADEIVLSSQNAGNVEGNADEGALQEEFESAIILPYDSLDSAMTDADEETLALLQDREKYHTVTATDSEGKTVILYMPVNP